MSIRTRIAILDLKSINNDKVVVSDEVLNNLALSLEGQELKLENAPGKLKNFKYDNGILSAEISLDFGIGLGLNPGTKIVLPDGKEKISELKINKVVLLQTTPKPIDTNVVEEKKE
jgi:hypothetical protein